MLCADGAANGRAGLRRAIYAYNHACWYVRDVLTLAARYAGVRKPGPPQTGFCAVHHRRHPKHSEHPRHRHGRAARRRARYGRGEADAGMTAWSTGGSEAFLLA